MIFRLFLKLLKTLHSGMEIRKVKIVLKYLFNSITFFLSLISKQKKKSILLYGNAASVRSIHTAVFMG